MLIKECLVRTDLWLVFFVFFFRINSFYCSNREVLKYFNWFISHQIWLTQINLLSLEYFVSVLPLSTLMNLSMWNWFNLSLLEVKNRNCADLFKSGERISGVYTISPDSSRGPFDVYCDHKTAGGGWTVIQKRLDGSVDFYRGWADYKCGFGNLNGEFWLGLDKMHQLTKAGRNIIRIELEDIKGKTAYADYDMFAVASERAKYQLSLGTYSGKYINVWWITKYLKNTVTRRSRGTIQSVNKITRENLNKLQTLFSFFI